MSAFWDLKHMNFVRRRRAGVLNKYVESAQQRDSSFACVRVWRQHYSRYVHYNNRQCTSSQCLQVYTLLSVLLRFSLAIRVYDKLRKISMRLAMQDHSGCSSLRVHSILLRPLGGTLCVLLASIAGTQSRCIAPSRGTLAVAPFLLSASVAPKYGRGGGGNTDFRPKKYG